MAIHRSSLRATITELGDTGRIKTTIGTLPDVALLEIFNFFVDEAQADGWHTLVHVCRRWRDIAFASPVRLDLQIICTNKRPVRRLLDIWPALAIKIQSVGTRTSIGDGADDIFAALRHRERVCHIGLSGLPRPLLKRLAAATQEAFPALTGLELSSCHKRVPVFPDSFLGGSAPRLRSLSLDNIPFPALPKLLSTTDDLVNLRLTDIPPSGYVSPEAMLTGLSGLMRLECLHLEFRSTQSPPGQISRQPPQTCIALPALLKLNFKGASEYLEVLVSRINAPILQWVCITFVEFVDQLLFNTSQLPQFIGRAEKFRALNRAEVVFDNVFVEIKLSQKINHAILQLRISCDELSSQLSSLARICGSFLPPLSTLERLHIHEGHYWHPHMQYEVQKTLWLELFLPFTAVKNLYLSKDLAIRIKSALQELTANRVTDVLPMLQNIFLKVPQRFRGVQEVVGQFVAARQLSGNPVVVHHWNTGTWVVVDTTSGGR